ncbi:MAG: amidohydrolase family protein [Deltaproteobacteria bacterium]|nr:amidohydrolase family protein [Deltaproteobacteria bacterium]MBW2725146.1 amidohydrolase family protein [Deltaproteobacteria bacterium]
MPQALGIATIDGARASGPDAQTGSIETGKSAGLIVVDRDALEIPTRDIVDTQVVMACFAGRRVFWQSRFQGDQTNDE